MKIPANSLLFTLKFPGRIRNIEHRGKQEKGPWSTLNPIVAFSGRASEETTPVICRKNLRRVFFYIKI